MLISRILHAGYLFEDDHSRILFDPIFETPFSVNCHAFPDVKFNHERLTQERFDAVVVSHLHEDHFSLESLRYLDRAVPIYFYCRQAEPFAKLREFGFINIFSLDLDVSFSIGDFDVTPRKALDPDVDALFQIQWGGLNVLNVVDAWVDPEALMELRKFAPWDLVLWPFQTMREVGVIAPSRAGRELPEVPHEWIEQLRELKPRVLVPSSCQFRQEPWSWYNHAMFPISYKYFAEEIHRADLRAEILRLNPGCSVKLTTAGFESRAPITWIEPVGDQDVDYDYDPDCKPPATSEIAKHFPELSRGKAEFVYEFCRNGLAEKFAALGESNEPYFQKPRNWRLAIFHSRGQRIDFDYRLCGPKIELLREGVREIEWLTEIPIYKLYAALTEAESLTSLYIRINDVDFTRATEQEIADADVIEDPLIRVLYTQSQ